MTATEAGTVTAATAAVAEGIGAGEAAETAAVGAAGTIVEAVILDQ